MMWNPAPSSIPPLPESDFLDVEKDILVPCKLCPSIQLTHSDLAAHVRMHDRKNHALALSKVERCQYAHGLKKSNNSGDLLIPHEAELVTDFYSDGHSAYIQRDGKSHGRFCNRSNAARCALKKATLFASLPYIEDQTYTFGEKYLSREEQGEFIPIPISNYGQQKPTCPGTISKCLARMSLSLRDHFPKKKISLRDRYLCVMHFKPEKISLRDRYLCVMHFKPEKISLRDRYLCVMACYWIRKTLDEDTLVRVNEVVVDTMLNIPLAPGDIISIANPKKDGFSEDYLFKLKFPTGYQKTPKKSLPGVRGMDAEEEGAKLAQYFSDSDVTRKVLTLFGTSSSWSRDQVMNMAVFKLARDLGHMDLKKWNVTIPFVSKMDLQKLRDDFLWLFSLDLVLTRHVTHLTLNGSGWWDKGSCHNDISGGILVGVASTLEYLNLRLGQKLPLQFPVMPLVTTFILNRSVQMRDQWGQFVGKDCEELELYEKWIKAAFVALPRLTDLTLEGLEYQSLRVTLEQLILFREGINDGPSMPPVALSIIYKGQDEDEIINETCLEILLSLRSSPSFYVREFAGTIEETEGHQTLETQIYQVLETWRNSLESLDLTILLRLPEEPRTWEENWSEELGRKIESEEFIMVGSPTFCLRLPSPMQELRRLSLTWFVFGDDIINDGIRMEIGGRDRLDYSITFPSLTELKIILMSEHGERIRWNQVSQIYDFFLPQNNEEGTSFLSDTLRLLEVPLVIDGQVRRRVEELQRSFPKATSLPEEPQKQVQSTTTWGHEDEDEDEGEEVDLSPFPDFMKWPALSGNDWTFWGWGCNWY